MKNEMTVEKLRKNNYKVRVIHSRRTEHGVVLPYYIVRGKPLDAKGGSTRVEITTPNGQELSAEARCSNKDNFNRKTGLAIALGRALSGRDWYIKY